MRSRKLQALDFIKVYFARWGGSPSLTEIADGLGVSRQRGNQLIRQLAREGLIAHTPGQSRSLRLVDDGHPVSRADVLIELRRLGFVVDEAADGSGAVLSTMQLLGLPRLDHDPDENRAGEIYDGDVAN